MVVNIVDVGWATSKSGCLPITAPHSSDSTSIILDKTIRLAEEFRYSPLSQWLSFYGAVNIFFGSVSGSMEQ